jgi:hypothetical protein
VACGIVARSTLAGVGEGSLELAAPARLVCIPTADSEFAAEAERIATRIPTGMPPADALRWYALAVRRVYPSAVVREQDELARMEGAAPVWYVSRGEHHFRIETSMWVPLDPDSAFRVYVDRMPDWQTAVQLVPERLVNGYVGSTYRASYSFLGSRYEGRFRILAAEPGHLVSLEAEGSGITVWYVTTFRPEQAGTHLAVKGNYELPNSLLMRVADRLGLERVIAADIQRANDGYRSLCARLAARESMARA